MGNNSENEPGEKLPPSREPAPTRPPPPPLPEPREQIFQRIIKDDQHKSDLKKILKD